MEVYPEIIKRLNDKKRTIATMESATGGYISSTITNYPRASHILKYSAVTYSNEFKIKMGVDPKVIEEYTVYSFETAKEMSKKISDFADSDYGVGITGKMGRVDEANPYGDDSIIFISIYDREKDTYILDKIKATFENRIDNKELVSKKVGQLLLEIL